MTATDADARNAWVLRVLGLDVRAFSGPAVKTMPIWQNARDAAGEQIGKLQGVMRNSGLPLFQRVADTGLNGFTQKRLVGMQVALMEFDLSHGEARREAAGKVRVAAQAMRSFLQSSPVPRLLDENPFGVPVSLRDGLTAALDQVERNLAT